MEHRFLLVLLPIVFATTEIVIRQHGLRGEWRWLVVCGVLGLAWVGTRFEVIKPYQKKWHLAAEHTWYRVESVFPLEIGSRYFRIGKGLKKALGDVQPPPRIAYPCVGLVGFYSELPLVDTYGLVNRNIARKPLKKRGRPGHEKRASLAEVIKEGAVLSYERYAPKGMNRYLEVKLGGTGLFLLDDLESTKSRLKGAKVKRWPRSVKSEVVRATSLGDRSRLVDLTNFGARLLAPTLRKSLSTKLGMVDALRNL